MAKRTMTERASTPEKASTLWNVKWPVRSETQPNNSFYDKHGYNLRHPDQTNTKYTVSIDARE